MIGYTALGHPCGRCTTKTIAFDLHTRIYRLVRTEPNRTRDEILAHKESSINGFHGDSPWFDVLLPIDCRLDALHLLEEGLLGRVLNIFVPPAKINEYHSFYMSAKYPTQNPLLPRSLLEYGRFNGGDKRAVSTSFSNCFISNLYVRIQF